MKLIVGLGNPGEKYTNTRHNSGFCVLDNLAKALNLNFNKSKFNALYTLATINNTSLILLKPQTYMNESGLALRSIMDFYKISVEDIVVVYDDVALPVGKIRLRQQGSSAGQNGVNSIITHLHTQHFNRIRIGVGKDEHIPLINWVLGKISSQERDLYDSSIDEAVLALKYCIDHDFTDTMNLYNKK